MKQEIFNICLYLCNILVIIIICSLFYVKINKQKTYQHKCGKNNLLESFKPYNDSYDKGFSIDNVLCSNLDISQTLNAGANMIFYNTTKDDSSKTDKNKTISISKDGNISGVKTLSSTDIKNSNKISSKDISNSNIIETKDLTASNNIKVNSLNNIMIGNITLLDALYPIGSIYISTNKKDPNTFIGGKWEQITDKFLWCGNNNSTALTTGGSYNVKLSVDNLPSHNHELLQLILYDRNANVFNCIQSSYKYKYSLLNTSPILNTSCHKSEQQKHFESLDKAPYVKGSNGYNDWLKIANTGGNKEFSIIPPYTTVFAWIRKE